MIATSNLLFQNENLIFLFANINHQFYLSQIQFISLQHISVLLSLSVMTFNQLDSLLSFTSSQSVSLVNVSFISENSVDLQNFTSGTVEVNELSSTLEQVNCRNTYYVI